MLKRPSIYSIFLITLLNSVFPSLAFASTQSTILVLGDSISAAHGIAPTKGWVALLQKQLNELSEQNRGKKFNIINASISGDTTDDGLARLPALLKKYHPMLTIIELGGNDGLRGFPLNIIKKHLGKMVELSQMQGSKVLLLGMRIPPNYGRRYADGFFSNYAYVANQYDIPYVPFLLEGVGGHPSLMQADGIHPNAIAQPILLKNLWSTLQSMLKLR
jgi:acyl-CoA thioesterase-1